MNPETRVAPTRSIVTSCAAFVPIVCALAACSAGPGGEDVAQNGSPLVIPKCPPGYSLDCSGDGPNSQIICTCVQNTPTYPLPVQVTGLTTQGLVLMESSVTSTQWPVASSGSFTMQVPYGSYSVFVAKQPTGQACVVANGTGYMTGSGTPTVQVTCGAAYTVGGTVTGLAAGGLVELDFSATGVQNDNFSVQQNGSFTAPFTVTNGTAWSLSVSMQPQWQQCTVSNGSGTIAGASVNDVYVSCSTCGGNQQPECTSGAPCQPGYDTAQGTCTPCGGSQEPECTSGSACQSGYVANAQGVCVACGGDEEPACSAGTCNSGYTVNAARSVCVPCGQPGLLACNGIQCASGSPRGKRCIAANATSAPELVVMCAASDFPGVVVDPIYGTTTPMASSPFTTMIPDFFTTSGSGTDNLFDWFTEASYGRLDRSGTVVVPWTAVSYTRAQLGALGRAGRVRACVDAAKAANPSLDTSQFVDFVAAFNVQMDGGNGCDSTGCNYVSTDPQGIFTNFMAQEVTHALGQSQHTERVGCVDSSGNPKPYCDPWDEMSAANDYSSANSIYYNVPSNFGGQAHSSAVGLVAGNLFVLGSHQNTGILAPAEVYTAPTNATETVTLDAINRDELTGIRVIEIPAATVYYTVELRRNTGWDHAVPETAVLVHSVDGSGLVTLIPKVIGSGDGSYTSGDVLTVGNATVTIGTIDTASSKVPVTIKD